MENKEIKTTQPDASAKKKNGKLMEFLKSRKARHGALAVGITIIVIALIVGINIAAGLLTERFPALEADLTPNAAYELQEDTIDYVSHLQKDVTVNIFGTKDQFTSGGEYYVQADELLDKMATYSNGKIKVKYVDITSNPGFTQGYTDIDWTSSKNVGLVECGKEYSGLTVDDCFEYDESTYEYYGYVSVTGTKVEQAVVTAILNVTTEDKVLVDLITGNQEQDYSAVSALLNNNAYTVNEVSLATNGLDKDAKFAVLFAPTVDLDESAVEKLSDWLKNDGAYGKTFIYVANIENVDTPNINSLLEEWGMSVSKDFVFETSENRLVSGAGPYIFTVDYNDYYTDKLKNPDIPVVSVQSHNIEITDDDSAHVLLKTSDKAGIRPVDADDSWDYNEAITGEPIAVAAEGKKTSQNDGTESSVVVFGSDAMFSKSVMDMNAYNNSAFLINIFNTTSDKSDTTITIEGKSLENETLGTIDMSTSNALYIIFVFALPGVCLIAGIVVWIRRRHK